MSATISPTSTVQPFGPKIPLVDLGNNFLEPVSGTTITPYGRGYMFNGHDVSPIATIEEINKIYDVMTPDQYAAKKQLQADTLELSQKKQVEEDDDGDYPKHPMFTKLR